MYIFACCLAVNLEDDHNPWPICFSQHKMEGKMFTYARCRIQCVAGNGPHISQMAVYIAATMLPRSREAHCLWLSHSPRDHGKPEGQLLPLSPSQLFAFSPWLTALATKEKPEEKASQWMRWGTSAAPRCLPLSGELSQRKGTHQEDNSHIVNECGAKLWVGGLRWHLKTLKLPGRISLYDLSPPPVLYTLQWCSCETHVEMHVYLHQPLARSLSGSIYPVLWRWAEFFSCCSLHPCFHAQQSLCRNQLRL